MLRDDKIFIAGHRGLAGSAILRKLESENYRQIITRTRAELDLTRQSDVENFFAAEKPEIVFLAAGKVGGIQANSSLPSGFYPRQSFDTNERHRRGISLRREKTTFLRLVLYLSEARAAASKGRISFDIRPRAD